MDVFHVRNFAQRISNKGLGELNSIFMGRAEGQNRIDVGVSKDLTLYKKGDVVDPRRVDFTIDTRDRLPEEAESHLTSSPTPTAARPAHATALRYEIEVAASKDSYKISTADPIGTRGDCIYKSFDFPCRLCTMKIFLANDQVHHEWGKLTPEAILLDADHPLEAERIEHQFLSSTELDVKIWYPMPGIQYRINLNFCRVGRLEAGDAASATTNWGVATPSLDRGVAAIAANDLQENRVHEAS